MSEENLVVRLHRKKQRKAKQESKEQNRAKLSRKKNYQVTTPPPAPFLRKVRINLTLTLRNNCLPLPFCK